MWYHPKRSGFAAYAALAAALACSRPAWAQPPAEVHPSWTKIDLRPANFQPEVAGFGWLSDGSLVVGAWGGKKADIATLQHLGAVYIVKGVTGDAPHPVVSTFASGLDDPMGLMVQDDRIYLTGGQKLLELPDANHDGKADDPRAVITFPGTHARHEFLFGLNYKDGIFYVNPSSAQGAPQSHPGLRGTVQLVNAQTGTSETLAMGLREPNGGGFGPEGEYFVPDVQGNWLPANKLINIRKGRFYGFKHTPPETWDNMPESPAAVYIPQDEVATALSQPLYVEHGIYAGQMLMGDVHTGGIRRIFLEKVKGEWQGAVFFFTGGLESGTERLSWGPDGMLYAGGSGGYDGGWSYKLSYGLQKLKFNGKPTFEMLAVRALVKALEIEFTEPVADAASAASNYTVQTWYYKPTAVYGGPPIDQKYIPVKSVSVSPDRMRVTLELPDLIEGRVVRIKVPAGFKSQSGDAIWTKDAWYTHNFAGPGTSVSAREVEAKALARDFKVSAGDGSLRLHLPFQEACEIRLLDLRGSLVGRVGLPQGGDAVFSVRGVPAGLYLVQALSKDHALTRRIAIP